MVLLIQTGRVNDVGVLNRVDEVQNGDAGYLKFREIGDDVKFRNLAALHGDGRHASYAIERRSQLVRCQLPQFGLTDGVALQAVAEDGKRCKGQSVGGDLGGCGKFLLDARQGRIDQLQRLEHIGRPVKKQADFGGAAAGGGTHGDEPGYRVHRGLNGFGDGDFHLLDRHDAVIDADDDAREIGFGEDGDRHLQRGPGAGNRKRDDKEEDRSRGPRQPERTVGFGGARRSRHQSVAPAFLSSGAARLSSSAGPIFTLVPSSSP